MTATNLQLHVSLFGVQMKSRQQHYILLPEHFNPFITLIMEAVSFSEMFVSIY
jgi:hypothetical protein